ncbi:hypothetical protein F4861DRAFT_249047 [Xylaria intraflava]|nr:hypothetical protein F4861DRAFT_249047 [Xylaria intraflava]
MQVAANRTRAQPPQLCHDDTRKRPITHSGPLVYARPQDLPSFSSIGFGVSACSAAAAATAATLGWANKRSPEPARPGNSISDSTAVAMAEDNKSARIRESVGSSQGTNAALLAAQSATSHSVLKPSSADEGNTAATQALRLNRTDTQNTDSVALDRHGSLAAAQGAVARRLRAESTPNPRQSYLDEASAVASALSAATRAHRLPTPPLPLEDVGAVPYTTMDRQMFTSRPPVQAEIEEKKRTDVLHASAVAMAKKLYDQQQKMIEARKCDADRNSQRDDIEVSSSISDDPQSAQLTTLQDAAYKQAQARLAKIQLENDRQLGLKGHHGTNPLSRHFSVKEKLRKRSSSDGAIIEDRKRSQQIRKQMSLFSNKLSDVNEQKLQHDQDMLLAAAQRNVHERLRVMDEQIAAETGMVPPGASTQREFRARTIAPFRTFRKESHQQGKVNVGAGRDIDQEDVNTIAARRIQPLLDEINAKAELEHARQAEIRLEAARKKEEREAEKARQREIQDTQNDIKQRAKQEQKERKAEEKQETKVKKEEKATKLLRKRLVRAETSKSTIHDQRGLEPNESIITMNSSGQPVKVPRPRTQENATTANIETSRDAETSRERPKFPPDRLYNWFKTRFSRKAKLPAGEQSDGQPSQKGFIGGVSLTGYENTSYTSFDNRSASVRAVAMAGRHHSLNPSSRPEGGTEAVSSLESDSDDEFFRYGAGARPIFTPPKPIRTASPAQSQGSVRDSRFHEDI